MGNLDRALDSISHWRREDPSGEISDILDCIATAFCAYHDVPVPLPKPKPPEFKPDDWVMHRSHGLLKLIKAAINDGWMAKKGSESYHLRIAEDYICHATNAEMFRPGAVARYEYGKTTVEGEVLAIERDTSKLKIKIEYDGSYSWSWVYPKYCTLITAAPAGEAGDE